jgi:hypothetical protein
MDLLFSDVFKVDHATVESYGAFDIALVADLPLFVDPFLIFNSNDPTYLELHEGIVKYLLFLHKKAQAGKLSAGLIDSWYRFPEIKQNWLGFSTNTNQGRGLGRKFATALHENLHALFSDFADAKVTKGIHLEKLCLVSEGVGRDSISDFTNNLIHGFLLKYTQAFAVKHIHSSLRRRIRVSKVRFNYDTETWASDEFELPIHNGSHVILTPIDLLTKDDTWINKHDLVDYSWIPNAIANRELREQVDNYFRGLLPKQPTTSDEADAVRRTLLKFPSLIDYYIRYKEDHGDRARSISSQKVEFSQRLYLAQFASLPGLLNDETDFYRIEETSLDAARRRAQFLKDVIENKGGHRIFYVKGRPIEREEDLQILYRLTWFATSLDVSREVNDGRGPVDFKVSRGAIDKTLVEMKLAGNSQLKRNLERQAGVYEKASDVKVSIKVILCFSQAQQQKVSRVLRELKMTGDPNVVVIDARTDNKPSGSRA